MKKYGIIIGVLFLASCASQSNQPSDLKADSTLGVNHEEQDHETAQALADMRAQKIDESQQNLQRQIADPTRN